VGERLPLDTTSHEACQRLNIGRDLKQSGVISIQKNVANDKGLFLSNPQYEI
jgi:hypothetical protein